jgi:hypothetical protein
LPNLPELLNSELKMPPKVNAFVQTEAPTLAQQLASAADAAREAALFLDNFRLTECNFWSIISYYGYFFFDDDLK